MSLLDEIIKTLEWTSYSRIRYQVFSEHWLWALFLGLPGNCLVWTLEYGFKLWRVIWRYPLRWMWDVSAA